MVAKDWLNVSKSAWNAWGGPKAHAQLLLKRFYINTRGYLAYWKWDCDRLWENEMRKNHILCDKREVWDRKPAWIRQFVRILYTHTAIYLDNPTPACIVRNAVCRSGSESLYLSLSKYFLTLWLLIDKLNRLNLNKLNTTYISFFGDYTP